MNTNNNNTRQITLAAKSKLANCLERYIKSTDIILRDINEMKDCLAPGVSERIRSALAANMECIESAIGMQVTSCIRQRIADEYDG